MSKYLQKISGMLLASTIALVPAAAQPAPSGAQATQVLFDHSKEFNMVELVPGLSGTQEEFDTLKTKRCLMGPPNLVAPIIKKMGTTTCDTKMFQKLGSVHKTGSLLWMLTVTPVGIKITLSDKAVNLGLNFQDGMIFPFKGYADPRIGMPLVRSQGNVAGGESTRTGIMGNVLAAGSVGLGSTALSLAADPCRKSGNPCGATYNFQGGTAFAAADSNSNLVSKNSTKVDVGVGTACAMTGACGTPPRQ
jgi:hypothetical protein